ncbi:DUF2442 domain-containing protein [soil metagenome]
MIEIKMVDARRVKALDDYRLEIVFDDDTMGVVDLSDFVQLGPVTEPLRDPAFFARAFVEMGVPTWPNGCDIDPINAWMELKAAGELRPVTAAA